MRKTIALLISAILIMTSVLAVSCSSRNTNAGTEGKDTSAVKLKAIIVPKIELGEMSGDFPGEAQLFYEKYCPDAEETEVPHMPDCAHFYVNEEDGIGILVTDSSKTAASLSLMALLSCEKYDHSEATIISVGCAGGSKGYSRPGDVVLITAVCDSELGHMADVREMEDKNSDVTWFHDSSYDDFSYKDFNEDTLEKVYKMTKDCKLRTTKKTDQVMAENFPGEDWALRRPEVIKGTSLTGDNFWKGEYGHKNALFITDYYNCPDPYAVTEMEEISVANAAECYGMLEHVVSFRVIVNMDVFLKGETPEGLWDETKGYNDKVEEDNSETLDIFEPAMHNLFDTASIVIDAAVNGQI
ncbi:MAG: hypothetical protein IKF07_01010 [Eubacterium sp.]|nr:hypothetical protein [Eubacterium sp.]